MPLLEYLEGSVALDVDEIPVVEARAPDRMVFDGEPQRSDEVQWRLGRSAGACDRPGVRRDLRFDQNHVKRSG